MVGDGLREARNALVETRRPHELVRDLKLVLPDQAGQGRQGLLDAIQRILDNSVNTWDQGFLDKLYSSTNAVGQLPT